jgi:hypothetical protein
LLVDLGRGYLELVLRLRRLAPSLVDSYSGRAELAALIDAEPRAAALELHEQAQELQRLVGAHEPNRDRREWLRAQLAGISTALLWLAGEQFSYRELTERCHGVIATLVPQDQFELAHCKLDRVLPGRGDVRDRYQRWAQNQLVPRGLLLAGLQSLAKELRRRSAEKFQLPAGERVVFELVSGKAYGGIRITGVGCAPRSRSTRSSRLRHSGFWSWSATRPTLVIIASMPARTRILSSGAGGSSWQSGCTRRRKRCSQRESRAMRSRFYSARRLRRSARGACDRLAFRMTWRSPASSARPSSCLAG